MKNLRVISVAVFIFTWVLALPSTALFALEETGGIGMTVAQLYDESTQDHRGYLVVLDVFKDSPAESAGVERGDIITHINGQFTKGKDLMGILKNEIRGTEGTEVKLKVWRYSTKKRLEIKLTRVPIFY